MKTQRRLAVAGDTRCLPKAVGIALLTLFFVFTANTPLSAQVLPPVSLDLIGYFGGNMEAGAVRDNYAFVAQGGMLKTLDLTQPTYHVLAAYTFSHSLLPAELYLQGNTCYLRYERDHMLEALDISDPLNVRKLGSLELGTKRVDNFAFAGHYIYAAQREKLLKKSLKNAILFRQLPMNKLRK